MPLPDSLRDLLTAPGPSGRESAAAVVWQARARTFTDDVTVDVMGNSVARVPGLSGGPLLAVVGHIDEIGLLVTNIEDSGMLRFVGVGGWDPQILIGQRVELLTRDGVLPAVVGKKPIHLLREEDCKKVAEIRDLHIDVGAAGAEEAQRMVRVGDVGVIAGDPVDLPNRRVA